MGGIIVKFFNILNVHSFFEEILACEGRVERIAEGGERQDLKRMAEYLISSGMLSCMRGIDSIEVVAERACDRQRLMRHMREMCVHENRLRRSA